MVPIYDSDLAEQRWAKAQWSHYELWEKKELRHRRHRRWCIILALLLFLIASSIPVIIDKQPKWKTFSLAQRLAKAINRVHTEASIEHKAIRLKFLDQESFLFQVEQTDSCLDSRSLPLRTETLEHSSYSQGGEASYQLLRPGVARQLDLTGGGSDSYCYDPMNLNSPVTPQGDLLAFAFVPVKDLPQKRLDRISIVFISGASGEIALE